ncbi:MAG: ABC transporter substrate-binding protein [Oscillospiraceae bacterium]|nr:ABC transporter substrate-binding protein [Oscillospiraceae bacterium]
MRKLLTILLAAALAMALLAGCGGTSTDTPPADTTPPADLPTIDRAGNPITAPLSAERIVALSPAVTQTLLHMGLADKIVAIDTNSLIFEGLPADLPTVDMLSPDGELLLTLNADLVLCSSMTGFDGGEPLKPLSDSGICVAAIPSSASIEGIKEDIMFIADIVGQHDEGAEIIAELEAGIQEVRDAIGAAAPKTVYFEIAAAPAAYSFGNGTFLNEMIEIAGGENIFSDMDSWLAVSEEQVIARNPEVIFTNVIYIENSVGEILSRESLADTTAVTEENVYYVDNYSSSLANEYILTAIHQMAEAMHPDLWKNS